MRREGRKSIRRPPRASAGCRRIDLDQRATGTASRSSGMVMRRQCSLLLLLALGVGATKVRAMSYAPLDDAALYRQADAIVLGEVIAREPAPARDLDETRSRVHV